MRWLLLFYLSMALVTHVTGQESSCPDSVFKEAGTVPDSVTHDPVRFASWLHHAYPSDECAAKVLYAWLAGNIDYDLDMLDNPPVYRNAGEMVLETLASRRGVCSHYAETFRDILSRTGVQVAVVSGYTRVDNVIDIHTGHAWNAALIDGRWVLFDATWGGGFLRDNRYYRRFSTKYCMAPPDSMITEHMPFDPMWQLTILPVRHDGFFAGRTHGSDAFAWQDSIAAYLATDSCSRIAGIRARCVRYGIGITELDVLREKYYQSLANEGLLYSYTKFSITVNRYNALSEDYNRLITGMNKRKLSLAQQKAMLKEIQAKLPGCKAAIEERYCPDPALLGQQNKLMASFGQFEKLVLQVARQLQPSQK